MNTTYALTGAERMRLFAAGAITFQRVAITEDHGRKTPKRERPLTDEEKRQRQRGYEAAWRQRTKKPPLRAACEVLQSLDL